MDKSEKQEKIDKNGLKNNIMEMYFRNWDFTLYFFHIAKAEV